METRESHRTSTRPALHGWSVAAVIAFVVTGVRAVVTAGAALSTVDVVPVVDRRRKDRSRRVGASARVRGAPAPRSWAQGFDKPLA
jgi:hypothetical protein